VVPGLNNVIHAFEKSRLPIFFTRDWHPPNHISFRRRGGPWPPHCIQGSVGAGFHPDLRVPSNAVIISKGDDASKEAYSGFQGTNLKTRLKNLAVDEVVIGGLTTDYCVRQTALDALQEGLAVDVLEDCVRAVDVRVGDGARALTEMRKAGAKVMSSSEVIKGLAGAQQ